LSRTFGQLSRLCGDILPHNVTHNINNTRSETRGNPSPWFDLRLLLRFNILPEQSQQQLQGIEICLILECRILSITLQKIHLVPRYVEAIGELLDLHLFPLDRRQFVDPFDRLEQIYYDDDWFEILLLEVGDHQADVAVLVLG
jgi:hypothetical protein